VRSAFIFHGTVGHPQENWFPWLKTALNECGFFTLVPQFPTPEKQSLSNWLRVMEPHFPLMNEETILIGHSVGGIFALRILEQLSMPIRAAFVVGSYIGIDEIKGYTLSQQELFLQTPFDWKKIRANAHNLYVYHSDNDPNVTLDNGNALANHLGITLSFLPNCGHFNEAAGMLKFPALLSDIESLDNPCPQAKAV